MKVPSRIPVELGDRRYDIWIGSGHLGRFGTVLRNLPLEGQAVVLSNRTILARYGVRVTRALKRAGFPVRTVAVGDSERSKSLATLSRVLRQLADFDRPGRRLFLVLMGGGVVGDLGGLAAGLYRRGIPCVQLPTTLLAQVDSAIGGKTAVDLPHGKNLVGLIVQPRLVYIDLEFLRTLPDRQFRSGLAEVIKCGVIRDAGLFSRLEQVSFADLRRSEEDLGWVIARAARVKASWVASDEYERRGQRTLLNFGHTFGHALEAASGYTRAYTHGEAVALGMQVASEIARRLGKISARDARRLRQVLERMGLPVRAKGVARSKIWRAMAYDKKWIRTTHRWVLPMGIGRSEVRDGVPDRVVRSAVESVLEG